MARLAATAAAAVLALSCADQLPSDLAVAGVAADSSGGDLALARHLRLASITVAPNTDTVSAGGTQSFTAVGRDRYGRAVAISPTWTVVAGGGTITAAGLFTAGTAPGTYTNTIRASSGAISGTATVTVLLAALASITVTPTADTLRIGGTQQFTAVGKDAAGNGVAITPAWTVAAGGGTITGAGLFTAGSALGTYANTIQASSGGISGRATVTVLPGTLASITVAPTPDTLRISGTQQFTAVGRDATGNAVAITPTWSVAAGGGTITSSGMFTAGSVSGTYPGTVRATSAGTSGAATVTVSAGAISTTTSVVSVSSGTVAVGGSVTLTLQARDAAGNLVTTGGAVVVFSASGGTSTGTISSTADKGNGTYTATFTGVGAGTATTLSATIGGSAVTTAMPTVTVGATGYAAPDLVKNASFEATDGDGSAGPTGQWDGFTQNSGSGTPTGYSSNGTYASLTLDTAQHYSGAQSVNYTWWANPGSGDQGAQMQYTFAGKDRIWHRIYFRLASGWKLSIQKLITYKDSKSSTILADMDLMSQDGLKFFFVSEASGAGTTIFPTASITNDTWHCLEIDLWRNGDTSFDGIHDLPSAAFWLDGVQKTHADGPDPALGGTYLYWKNNRLYPYYPNWGRSTSAQLALVRHVTTHNSPNSDSGTLWLDRIAISSLGRIGP